MSFREFKEEMYLVLQIRGGHGFGFATSPLLVTANLLNHVHESFIVEPSPQPKFENEFVWIMEKARMKSLWTEKISLKIDCYAVSQNLRNRIGYIILNVKEAQIINDESKVVEKQMRLLSVSKDASALKPELFLAFYITDMPRNSAQLTPQFFPLLEGRQSRMASEPINVALGAGKDQFNLSIKVNAVNNIKELLPSHSEVEPDLMTYTYSLLGAEIMTTVSTNHCAALRITSTLTCLKTYFVQQPKIPVKLHMGSLLVGNTEINIENFLLSEEALSRKGKHQSRTMGYRCFVTPTHDLGEPTLEGNSKPSVDFSVTLGWKMPVVKKKSEAHSGIGAGGDADRQPNTLPLKIPVTLPLSTQSCVSVTSHTVDSGGETYRKSQAALPLTLSVGLVSLHLDQPLPTNTELRLTHSSGCVTPQHATVLSSAMPAQWNLSLTVPRHLLESTLSTHPPLLILEASGGGVIANAELRPPHDLMKPCECTSSLEKDGKELGKAVITWALLDSSSPSQSAATLTDLSISPPTRTQSKTTYAGGDIPLSPRSRELKVLSFVEELEDWAEKQRIMVMEGLKEEETARLAALQRQWEAEVGGQVAEGKQLVEALHCMRDQLRQKETDLRDKEHKMKIYKEDLERVHRNKLQEFKDLSRRMQDEFNHKLALIAAEKVALETDVAQLRLDNTKLKQTLKETETGAERDKKAVESLTHELDVLKEKLRVEQESKQFFKEHCRKAEQEIHRLNILRQQELERRLHSEKQTLGQLALQHLAAERTDLRQDQRQLEEIRRELLCGTNSSGDASNSNVESRFTYGHTLGDDRHIRRAT